MLKLIVYNLNENLKKTNTFSAKSKKEKKKNLTKQKLNAKIKTVTSAHYSS
jgi:hypothetical protein